jgi:hypothetical protein
MLHVLIVLHLFVLYFFMVFFAVLILRVSGHRTT